MGIEHFNEKDFKRIAFWGKIVGSVISLYGLLVGIQALLSSPVGMIPAVVAFFVGSFIFASAEHAKKFIDSKGKDSLEIKKLIEFIGQTFISIGITICIFIVSYGLYVITA